MKKALSLLLILILLFSFSGCEKEEVEEKPMTAYIDWFGVTIDVRQLQIVIGASHYVGDLIPFDTRMESLENSTEKYVILRAKCVGNWNQKFFNYDDTAHFKHHYPNHGDAFRLYMEIPFEILEVLEGDSTLIEGMETVSPEITDCCVTNAFMFNSDVTGTIFNDKMMLNFNRPSKHLIVPRVGYEYIIILKYHEETQCLQLVSSGAECELSTPKEYYEYVCSIYNRKTSSEVNYDDYLPPYYYEILDRYNITVE